MKTAGRGLSILASTRIVELAVAFAIGFMLYLLAYTFVVDVVYPVFNVIFGTDISVYDDIQRGFEDHHRVAYSRLLADVIAIGLLLLIGSLVLHLVRGAESTETKECPYCLSEIPAAASVCSYCASDVSETSTPVT